MLVDTFSTMLKLELLQTSHVAIDQLESGQRANEPTSLKPFYIPLTPWKFKKFKGVLFSFHICTLEVGTN